MAGDLANLRREYRRWETYLLALAPVATVGEDVDAYIVALEAEVERLTAQRDWHQVRNDALQKVQRHMRDPERKAVCDILANGTTYVEPFRAALEEA